MRPRSGRRLRLAALLVPLVLVGAGVPSPAAAGGAGLHGIRAGYLTDWAIYSGFNVKNLVTQGAAGRLSAINYAFGNVAPVDPQQPPSAANPVTCKLLDPWADAQRPVLDPSLTVNGVADNWSQPLAGNFNQLRELKAQYPGLKVIISLGGWTLSKWFSDAALTPASRAALVTSCISLFIKGNLPGTPPGTAAGIFDGIDIDWEYPGSPGNAGNVVRPEDTRNFTLLLREFREQLDQLGEDAAHPLTAALPAGPMTAGKLEIAKVSDVLSWINLMTYDFHGPWEPTGPTNFNANLTTSPGDPAGAAAISVDSAVRYFLRHGAEVRKLVVGLPFYGHGWTGVPDGGSHGLYQLATGPTTGGPSQGQPGTGVWKAVSALGYAPYRDPASGGFYYYDAASRNWWSIDDPVELYQKMRYVQKHELGGAMMWALDQDDSGGSLVRAVDAGLNARADG